MDFRVTDMRTDDDIRGKAYVHWRSWQETYTGLMPREILDRQTLEKCTDIALRFREGLIVAKAGERVIGFAGYGAYRDDSLPDTGEVYALYVLQEFQGCGVGRALMQEALRRLRQYSRVALWVLKGNEQAIGFYRHAGFAFDGVEITQSVGTEQRMIAQNS